VEQFYALLDDIPIEGVWGSGRVSVWAETLSSSGAEILMRYGAGNDWLTGQPAVMSRPSGKGRITYVGALLDKALMQRTAELLTHSAGLRTAFGPVPADVEVCRRTGPRGDIFVLINHGKETRVIQLPEAMREFLAGGPARTSVELPRYGVAVVGR
jgi:beta-galactosidase